MRSKSISAAIVGVACLCSIYPRCSWGRSVVFKNGLIFAQTENSTRQPVVNRRRAVKIPTKRLSAALSTVFLIVALSAGAWAEEKVLTVYFAGTGNTKDGTEIIGGLTKYDPELMATLYARDKSAEDLSAVGPKYKVFVDGVGTHGCLASAANPLDHCILPLCCRGFTECLNEAIEAFNDVGGSIDLVLNLVGYSRGGVLPMKMARWVADNGKLVKKINILSFDPVPGTTTENLLFGDPIGQLGSDLVLPNIVHQYVGVYARDERSHKFETIIPYYDTTYVKDMLVSVRGSHETLDGNLEVDGHAATFLPITPWMATRDARLGSIYKISLGIGERLLSGPDWGQVEFSGSVFGSDPRSDFISFVHDMYAYPSFDYWMMHSVSFLYLFFSHVEVAYELLGRDHHLLTHSGFPPPHGRLVYRSNGLGGYRHEPEYIWWLPPFLWLSPDQVYMLDNYVEPIDGATAWARMEFLRGEELTVDDEPPVPVIADLPDIVGECSAVLTTEPTATDNKDGTITGTTPDPREYMEQGTYEVIWTYTDQAGNTASQAQTIIVEDTIPPSPEENPLPVIEGQCSATITAIPSAVDNCTGPVTAYTSDPLDYSAQGTYEVIWVYEDEANNTETQSQTVIVEDSTPPIITDVTASPDYLWPPNRKMSLVLVDVAVADNCDATPVCWINSVRSNEPQGRSWFWNRRPDWRVVGDHKVKLRAESNRNGIDRRYAITEKCTDRAGNSSRARAFVTVPHDRRKD